MNTDRFRATLMEERERVQNALSYITAESAGAQQDEIANELSTYDNHLGDAATTTFNRELDDTLGENAEHVLGRIDAALRRIDAGTYGTCERCGRQIPEERLEARPWAALCIECQRLEDHAL